MCRCIIELTSARPLRGVEGQIFEHNRPHASRRHRGFPNTRPFANNCQPAPGTVSVVLKTGRKPGILEYVAQVMAAFNPMDLLGISLLLHLSFSFLLLIVLVPVFLLVYPALTWSRKAWIRFVKWKYPNVVVVEENSIRTILDQFRNHGIYTLLIQGHSIAEGIRGHLMHLTSSRRFLRAGLSTRWGLYVWRDLDYFSVDSHLLNSSCSFRGRPITESNIQDYVSDLTSKFFPSGQPPWQVHVINCFLRGEEYEVCLVRVHHLLLRQEHLALTDFLPLKYSTENWSCQEPDSPFTNLYAEPSALPKLYQKLTESFSNYWNEFLYNNDPNERPQILKKQIGILQCVKIGVIVLVCSLKELMRQYRKGDGPRFLDVFTVFQRESDKRNFGCAVFFRALLKSMNPLEILYEAVLWFWYFAITLALKSPILLLRELRALKSRHKHYHPDTLTSMLWYYLPLLLQAFLEAVSITWISIRAPKMILEELFLKHPQANRLQTTSPCGRKVVAWSEEVELDVLRKIANMTGATEAEILLTATVDALKEYFRHSGVRIPDDVLATGKFVRQRSIFVQNHETRGILCLALPTKTPLFEDDLMEILQVIQKNIREARSKQSAMYALTAAEASCGLISSCLPSLLLKVMLNQLTRRYSLSLTHVDGDLLVNGVDTLMYWRPPQGNCNMSITLHRYGNGVRLGVMGDALIGPEHSIITRTFPKSVENLANLVGVPRTQSRHSTPSPASPSTSPGY